MLRLRKRYNLARLMAVPLIVGVAFAIGGSWPVSAVNAALWVIPEWHELKG